MSDTEQVQESTVNETPTPDVPMPDEQVTETVDEQAEQAEALLTEETTDDNNKGEVDQEETKTDISKLSDEEFDKLDLEDVEKLAEEAEGNISEDTKDTKDTKDIKEEVSANVNPEEFYKTLTEPLKVNGVEVRFDDPEQIRTLISRGIGSNKRMQELKPTVVLKKSLEDAGLDDPQKLNFMIDVMKGKPEALSQFLKDQDIDPFDIDVDLAEDYEPDNNLANEQSIALDEVIQTINESPESAAIDEITDGFADEDINAIQQDPTILSDLHEHVKSGEYTQITQEVVRQQALGQLPPNLSKLQAYAAVYAQKQQGAQQQQQQVPNAQQASMVANTPSASTQKRIAAQKAAAASNRSAGAPSNNTKVLDISKMSDEEFSKLDLETVERLTANL